jgi:hypothetical protein
LSGANDDDDDHDDDDVFGLLRKGKNPTKDRESKTRQPVFSLKLQLQRQVLEQQRAKCQQR